MEGQTQDATFWKLINIAALIIMACSSQYWPKSDTGKANAKLNDFVYEMANRLNDQSRELDTAVALRVESALKQAHPDIKRSRGVPQYITALRATCDGAFLTVIEEELNVASPNDNDIPSTVDKPAIALPIISGMPNLDDTGESKKTSPVHSESGFLDFEGGDTVVRVLDVTADVANVIRGLPAKDLHMIRKKIQVHILWKEIDEYLPCYTSPPENMDEVRTKSGRGCFTLWKPLTVDSIMDDDHELLRAIMAMQRFYMIPTGMRDRAGELLSSIQV